MRTLQCFGGRFAEGVTVVVRELSLVPEAMPEGNGLDQRHRPVARLQSRRTMLIRRSLRKRWGLIMKAAWNASAKHEAETARTSQSSSV